jgi:hypothetical protein
LAPDLPEVRLRGGEFYPLARGPAPFPLPGVPPRVRGGDDDFLAIYFSVSPQIRAIPYHRPETLKPFDYIYSAFQASRPIHPAGYSARALRSSKRSSKVVPPAT